MVADKGVVVIDVNSQQEGGAGCHAALAANVASTYENNVKHPLVAVVMLCPSCRAVLRVPVKNAVLLPQLC